MISAPTTQTTVNAATSQISNNSSIPIENSHQSQSLQGHASVVVPSTNIASRTNSTSLQGSQSQSDSSNKLMTSNDSTSNQHSNKNFQQRTSAPSAAQSPSQTSTATIMGPTASTNLNNLQKTNSSINQKQPNQTLSTPNTFQHHPRASVDTTTTQHVHNVAQRDNNTIQRPHGPQLQKGVPEQITSDQNPTVPLNPNDSKSLHRPQIPSALPPGASGPVLRPQASFMNDPNSLRQQLPTAQEHNMVQQRPVMQGHGLMHAQGIRDPSMIPRQHAPRLGIAGQYPSNMPRHHMASPRHSGQHSHPYAYSPHPQPQYGPQVLPSGMRGRSPYPPGQMRMRPPYQPNMRPTITPQQHMLLNKQQQLHQNLQVPHLHK